MHGFLRQSTASQTRTIGPFIDSTDFVSLENGLTIANTDILLKKNGGASAAKNSGGATADGAGGKYAVTFDATDTGTVGELDVTVTVAGALTYFTKFVVLEEAIYDALFAASANAFTGAAGSTTLTALATGSITAAVIANGAIDAATFAADVDAEILSYLVDDATRIDASALNTASGAIGSDGSGLTEAGGTGDQLTAINLPNQTMDITGNITGNLSGSVGSVTGNVGGSVASVTAGVTLANGAITDASLAGNMELVFETDFATNYNTTRNAWATNVQDLVGTTALALSSSGLDNITAWTVDVTGSLSGSVGSVTGAVGSVTGNVGGNVAGSVASVTGNVGGIAGTITTLDALDTAQDTQHGTTQTALTALQADHPNRPTRGVEFANHVFTMVDETDFNSPETGITVTAQISKDGGAFSNCTNSVTEISAGFYKITLTSTEMTCDVVALKLTGTGCAQRNYVWRNQPT